MPPPALDTSFPVQVVNSSKPFTINITITSKAWNKLDGDTQTGVENILASQPILLLSGGGRGNGLKYESHKSGWVFHTQTAMRLLASGPAGLGEGASLDFDKYYKH